MSGSKKLSTFTPADLSAASVWEFAGVDHEWERYVKPGTGDTMPQVKSDDWRPFDVLVRTSFKLADGTPFSGFIAPEASDRSELITLQPVIVTADGLVSFWCGSSEPDAEELAQSYLKLGRGAERVFPITFQADVDFQGVRFAGTIPGFMVLEHWKTGRTRTVA